MKKHEFIKPKGKSDVERQQTARKSPKKDRNHSKRWTELSSSMSWMSSFCAVGGLSTPGETGNYRKYFSLTEKSLTAERWGKKKAFDGQRPLL